MIKLIVSDMDGTLLNSSKEIDSGIFELIPKLKEKGIKFAVSSGRQYKSLRFLFEDYLEDIIIIADNGAFAMNNTEQLFSNVLEKDTALSLIDAVNQLDGIVPIVSGKYTSYTNTQEAFDVFSAPPLSYDMEMVEDFHNFDSINEILKVTAVVYDGNKPSFHRDRLMKIIPDNCNAVTSGEACLDMGLNGTNKGSGLAKIQKILGISPAETMVFGDEQNDLEMFQQADYSYAMEGAEEHIKKHAKFVAPSNNANGVSTTIKDVLKDIL